MIGLDSSSSSSSSFLKDNIWVMVETPSTGVP